MGLGQLLNVSIWGGNTNGTVCIMACSRLAHSVSPHLSLVSLPELSVKMKDRE